MPEPGWLVPGRALRPQWATDDRAYGVSSRLSTWFRHGFNGTAMSTILAGAESLLRAATTCRWVIYGRAGGVRRGLSGPPALEAGDSLVRGDVAENGIPFLDRIVGTFAAR